MLNSYAEKPSLWNMKYMHIKCKTSIKYFIYITLNTWQTIT